jgi:hypothetical protein
MQPCQKQIIIESTKSIPFRLKGKNNEKHSLGLASIVTAVGLFGMASSEVRLYSSRRNFRNRRGGFGGFEVW